MLDRPRLIVLLVALLGCSARRVDMTTEFDKYRVAVVGEQSGTPIHVDRMAPEERFESFVVRLKTNAGARPNFAGRYSLVLWSCGFICVGGAIVDIHTRALHWLPFVTASDCAGFDGPVLDYKANSRLLIVRGRIGIPVPGSTEYRESDCGVYRFVWTGASFRPIGGPTGSANGSPKVPKVGANGGANGVKGQRGQRPRAPVA